VPESTVISPLPNDGISVLESSTLQETIHREDAIRREFGHQLPEVEKK
jgi:hypothetical protein